METWFADMSTALGISVEQAKEVVSAGSDRESIQYLVLKELLENRKHFSPKPVHEFRIILPPGYSNADNLQTFYRAKNAWNTFSFDDSFTERCFRCPSWVMEPGQGYNARVFSVLKEVNFREILAFYRNQGAVLVGIQGLALAYLFHQECFSVQKTFSFDHTENMLRTPNDEGYRLPQINKRKQGWCFEVDLCNVLYPGEQILCFYPV